MPVPDPPDGPTEVARLNKIIRVLMDRAERSTNAQSSDFNLFQTTIMLEEQVRRRTVELEAALSKNEKMNRALRESEAKFRGLVSQSLVGIVIVEDGRFTYSNPKFDQIFGCTSQEVRSLGPIDMTVEDDRALVAENIRKRLSGEVRRIEYAFRGLRKDRSVVNIECHSSGMHVGNALLIISLIIDITERTRAECKVRALQDELREQSTHDALTGLYNRRFLEESIDRELKLADRAGYPVSVVMADLDHFKDVNDHHGHLAGDAVLRMFGDLMKRHARATDIYCRYGGEEFLLLLPNMPEEVAVERAERLRSALAAAPVDYDASRIAVTASFGIATFSGDGRTSDELIAAADLALYAAKASGRNRVEVSPRCNACGVPEASPGLRP